MIYVKGVSLKIKKDMILSDIDLHIEKGKITGLVGRNGSGKTMLMRTIAGLIFATTGDVEVNGCSLKKTSVYPASIGILIENPAFLDNYTGYGNLHLLASIQNCISDEDIRQALCDVGLDKDDRRKYRKYSLGMKQRLGIAAAIFEKPDIVILDEPINALDVDGVAVVKKLILREKERGAIVILSCHEEQFLSELSDELYLMQQGFLTKA